MLITTSFSTDPTLKAVNRTRPFIVKNEIKDNLSHEVIAFQLTFSGPSLDIKLNL